MKLEAGARLGHYRIIALLGRGGMADVYRAEDERLGREVALKAVPPEFARDPERVERFEREVRAAARLTHPNIVTVYEFGQGAGQHFYTMALMPGGDLKARIRAHPGGMPPAAARAVAAAMARALDYAHRQGFVHRDVKPENILFGEDGVAQLTDFGIARAMSSGTRMTATGMSIGSPHYMSPEQARGQAVDGRSDLYSLGVVLYEMLTGRVPFDAADTFAVAYSHINDPAPELPRKLARWQPVLDRLLAKSPDDRFGSGGELAEDLASDALPRAPATRVMPTGRDLSSPSRPQGPAPRLAALATTRRGPLAALAGAALALAVVTIGYVALQDAAEPPAPPPPPAPQELPVLGGGALLVAETTPPGAEVLVDGELVGETPLERADIRAGVREVTLRHPHYETVRMPDRNFEDGVALRVERVLTRGAGRLTVTATPRDAWIEIDGQRLAERTPVTLEDLPAGTVQLTVGAAEHRPLTVAVDIPRDGLARLEPALEPIPFGSLTLDLEPADATVTLAGAELRYRPGVRLPEGAHRVVVSREGYGDVTRTIDVSGESRFRIVLERREDVLFSEDFSSGTLYQWTTVGKGTVGGSPDPGRLSIAGGVLVMEATAGANYDVRATKEIRVERRYRGYRLSFDWKAVARETPWGLDAVRLLLYDDMDRLIGSLIAVNSGQTRRGGNVLDHLRPDTLSRDQHGGIGKLAETFDWQRVTLATSMIPGMDPRDVARLELRAWVYNDAGSGGEMHFDNFELHAGG